MKVSLVFDRSTVFALGIIKFAQLLNSKNEFVLAKQILKSGTSIGANIAEALNGQSRKDFLSKMSIALKEARETKYWLFLLNESHLVSGDDSWFLSEIEEIYAMLNKIVKTTRAS